MFNMNSTMSSVPLDGGFYSNVPSWIAVLAVPVTSVIFLRFFPSLFRDRLCDKFGNTIPQGPVGLPVLGKLYSGLGFDGS